MGDARKPDYRDQGHFLLPLLLDSDSDGLGDDDGVFGRFGSLLGLPSPDPDEVPDDAATTQVQRMMTPRGVRTGLHWRTLFLPQLEVGTAITPVVFPCAATDELMTAVRPLASSTAAITIDIER